MNRLTIHPGIIARAETSSQRFLDSLVRLHFNSSGKRWTTYRVAVLFGIASAVVLTIALSWLRGMPFEGTMVMILTAIATSLVFAISSKLLSGEEKFVYYRYLVAITVAIIIVIHAFHHPVLPHLDIAILAIGLAQAVGRVGCLIVGCCHGRPCKWGIRYTDQHAVSGFPRYLVGVRLFPLQALESLFVLCMVVAGTARLLNGSAPGAIFSCYVVVYAVGRFSFEFMRGDTVRPYWRGFSEAQWTSIALMGAVVFAQGRELLSFHLTHALALALLCMTQASVVVLRRLRDEPIPEFLCAAQIKEIAEAAAEACTEFATESSSLKGGIPRAIRVASTSTGVQISAGLVAGKVGPICHFSFSSVHGNLTARNAKPIANLIVRLRRLSDPYRLIPGSQGVFHLIAYCAEERHL
jgi:prolipoprotein diacylglyceryltransferase